MHGLARFPPNQLCERILISKRSRFQVLNTMWDYLSLSTSINAPVNNPDHSIQHATDYRNAPPSGDGVPSSGSRRLEQYHAPCHRPYAFPGEFCHIRIVPSSAKRTRVNRGYEQPIPQTYHFHLRTSLHQGSRRHNGPGHDDPCIRQAPSHLDRTRGPMDRLCSLRRTGRRGLGASRRSKADEAMLQSLMDQHGSRPAGRRRCSPL
jgi:hypothetical protein